MGNLVIRLIRVALLFFGSAILLYSCDRAQEADDESANETLMTEYSENLSVVNSQNGRRSYRLETPLVEGYMLAREPYREFRKGLEFTTFKDDSLSSVDAVLTADYAIYYEKRELWEARGNVVVIKSTGHKFYSQQLFWNVRTRRIYSNVDSKLVEPDGGFTVGESFESDDDFKDWRFRKQKGLVWADVTPSDSTAAASPEPAPRPAPAAPPAARPAEPELMPGVKMEPGKRRRTPVELSDEEESRATPGETRKSERPQGGLRERKSLPETEQPAKKTK